MTGTTGKRSPWWLWALVIGSMLVLLACNETTAPSGRPMSTPAAPAVTSTVLRPTVESAGVDLYLSEIEAHEAERAARATLQAVQAQQTATAVAVQATATQQAWNATATAEVQRAQATATAWILTIEAEQAQATATAEAQRRAEERAEQAAHATATVEALRFSATATADMVIFQATATAIAADREAIDAINAEIVERERLTTERERLVYPVRAYGPWALLIAVVAMILWGGWRLVRSYEMRLRAIPRDARGDAPVLVLQQGGRTQVIDVDPYLYGAAVIDADGDIRQPQLTADPEQQERIKRRDQVIDLLSRGLPGGNRSRRPGPAQAGKLMGGQGLPSAGPVRVIDPQQVRPWIRDVERQALAGAVVEGEILEES